MTAKEMFEELGFTYEHDETSDMMIYKGDYNKFPYGLDDKLLIYFDVYEKNYQVVGKNKRTGYSFAHNIDLKLNKVIQQQMKELGWLDE